MGVSSEAEALCEALHYLCLRLRARAPMQQFVLLDYHFPVKPVARKNLLQGGDPRLWPKEPEREVVLRLGLLGKSLPDTSPYKEGVFLLDLKILCPLGGSPANVRAVRFTGTNLYHPNVTNGYTLCHCRPDFLPHLHKQSHRVVTVLEEVAWRLTEPAVMAEDPLRACLAHPNSIRASHIPCCGIRWDAMKDYVTDRARFDRIASENARSVLAKVPQLMWVLNARPLEEQLLHEKGRRDFCMAAAHKMQEADASSMSAGPMNHLKDVGELVRAAMPMGSLFTDVCLAWSRLVVEGEAETSGARPKDLTVNLADGTLVAAPAPPGSLVVRPTEVSPRVHKPFTEQLMTMRFLRKLQTAVGKPGGGASEDGDNAGTPGKKLEGGAWPASPHADDLAGDTSTPRGGYNQPHTNQSFFPSLPPPFACQPVNRFAIQCGPNRIRYRVAADSSARPSSASSVSNLAARPTSGYGGAAPVADARPPTSQLSKSPPGPPAPPPAAVAFAAQGPSHAPMPCFVLTALSLRPGGLAPVGGSSLPFSDLSSAAALSPSSNKGSGAVDGIKARKARETGGGKEDKRAGLGGNNGIAAGAGASSAADGYKEAMHRTWVYREGEDYEGFCVLVLSRKDLSVISYERFSLSHPRGLEKTLAALSAEDVVVALHCTSWLQSPDVQARVDWLTYNSSRSLADVMKRCCASKWDSKELGGSFSMICIPGLEAERGHCREGAGSIEVNLVWNPYTGEYEVMMPEAYIDLAFRPPLLLEPSTSRTWVHADALMQVHLYQRRLDLARAFLFWSTEGVSVIKDPTTMSLRQWLTFAATVGLREEFPSLTPALCVRVFFETPYDRQLRARQQGMERIGGKPAEFLSDWNPRYYITWHEFQEALVRLAYYACADPRVQHQRAIAEAVAATAASTSPAGGSSHPPMARSISKLQTSEVGGGAWGPDTPQGPSLAMWGAAFVSVLRMTVTERLRVPEGSFEEEYKSPEFGALLKFRGREINRVFKERCGRTGRCIDFITWGEMLRKCGLCGAGVSLSRLYRLFLLANGGGEVLLENPHAIGLMTRQAMCWALARLSHEIYDKERAAKYQAQTSAAAHAQALAYAHAAAQSPLSRLEEVLDAARAAAGSPVGGRVNRDAPLSPHAGDLPSSPLADNGNPNAAVREGVIPTDVLAGSIAEMWRSSLGPQAHANSSSSQGGDQTAQPSMNGLPVSGQPLWERRQADSGATSPVFEGASATSSPRMDAAGGDVVFAVGRNEGHATRDSMAIAGATDVMACKPTAATGTPASHPTLTALSGPAASWTPANAQTPAVVAPPPIHPAVAKPSLRRILSRPAGGTPDPGNAPSPSSSRRRVAKSPLPSSPATHKPSAASAFASGGGGASAGGGEPSTWELPWESLPVQSTVYPPEFIPRPPPATATPMSQSGAAAGGGSSSTATPATNPHEPSLVLKFDYVLMCIILPCLRVTPRVNKFYLAALAARVAGGGPKPRARRSSTTTRPSLLPTKSADTGDNGNTLAASPSPSPHTTALPSPFSSQRVRAASPPITQSTAGRGRPGSEGGIDKKLGVLRRGRQHRASEVARPSLRGEEGKGTSADPGDGDDDIARPPVATGDGYHPGKSKGENGAENTRPSSAQGGVTLGAGMLRGQMPLYLPRRLHAPVRYREQEAERRLVTIPEDLVEKRGTSDGPGVDIVALYTLLDKPLPPSLHHLEAQQKAMRSHQAVLAQKERELESAPLAPSQGGPMSPAQPSLLAAAPIIKKSEAPTSGPKAAPSAKGVTLSIPPVQLPPVLSADGSKGAVDSPRRGTLGHTTGIGNLMGGQGNFMTIGQAMEALTGSRTARF